MKSCIEINKMLLTMTEAACCLNCSYSSVQKLVKNGKLPVIIRNRTYYILAEDLMSYIKSKLINQN